MKKKFTIALLLFVCAIFCALGLAACNSEAKVTGITLNKTELTLNVGQSEKLTASLSPEGAYAEVYWSSENGNIAQVDQTGTVFAYSPGTTTVTATTQNNLQAVCTVTVKRPAKSVYITDSDSSSVNGTALLVGSEKTLIARISPEDSTSVAVWTVDSPDVLSVDGGKITALSQGIATVTATADGESHSVTITVTEDGLEYRLTEDRQSYAVYSVYTEFIKDAENITVAAEFNGKPVTEIHKYVFYVLNKLLNINVPASIISFDTSEIGVRCCFTLESFTVDENNPVYASIGGVLYNKDVTELICVPKAIETVTLPKTVTKIPNRAFYERTSLSRIEMHDGVTSIGDWAFSDCIALHSFTVPENLTEIGTGAFSGCNKLWEIYNFSQLNIVTGGDSYTVTYGGIGRYALNIIYIKNYPSGIRETDEGFTFYVARDNKTYLVDYTGEETELTLPDDYDGADYEIYSYAFYGCKTVTSVTIPDSIEVIGDRAFSNCENLLSVYLGKGIKSIGESAFSNSKKLANINIQDGVNSIGKYAFAYCESLANVAVPDSVTDLGHSAFYSCDSLTNVVLGKGVTQIKGDTFGYCESLQEITVQDGLNYIGYRAFDNCTNLKKINFNGTTEQWNAVRKEENWDVDLADYTVHCTGGDVAKSGN